MSPPHVLLCYLPGAYSNRTCPEYKATDDLVCLIFFSYFTLITEIIHTVNRINIIRRWNKSHKNNSSNRYNKTCFVLELVLLMVFTYKITNFLEKIGCCVLCKLINFIRKGNLFVIIKWWFDLIVKENQINVCLLLSLVSHI